MRRATIFGSRLAIALLSVCTIGLLLIQPEWSTALAENGVYRKSSGPYWNVWVRDSDGSRPVDSLHINKRYKFSLDIARLSYSQGASEPLSNELKDYLRTYPYPSVDLVVRPVLLGGALALAEAPKSSLHVEVRKLKPKPNDEDLEDDLESSYRQLDLKLAKLIRAGSYELDLITKAEGCATVVFSVWDNTGTHPLDNVVYTTYVGQPLDAEEDCADNFLDPSSVSLASGLKTLFSVATTFPSEARQLDGALYVFDDSGGSEDRSVAIYADRSSRSVPIGECRSASKLSANGVYSWELPAPLSTLFGDNFVAKVERSREKARDGQPYPYEDLADTLKDALFPFDNAEARCALKALQLTAAHSESTARILVHAATGWGKVGYLPLGLLAASSSLPILQKPIMTVHPMEDPRYGDGSNCIQSWTFAVSDSLAAADADELPLLTSAITELHGPWVGKRLTNDKELGKYLSDAGTKWPPSQGLVLLAHHAAGSVWFEKQGDATAAYQVRRRFPPGSVAILAACSVAGLSSGGNAFLSKLGVDAAVVSPFPVPASYAQRFTTELATALQRSMDENSGPRLVDLLQRANTMTASYFRENRAKRISEDMGLEFVIAGDFSVRLCTANAERRPK